MNAFALTHNRKSSANRDSLRLSLDAWLPAVRASFGESATLWNAATSASNRGCIWNLAAEYSAELASIRDTARYLLGADSSLDVSTSSDDVGGPRLRVVVSFRALADVGANWLAFQRTVTERIPQDRIGPIVLVPDPRNADSSD